MIRVGVVTNRDIEKCQVRVEFEQDDLQSPWAQVIQPLTVSASYYRLPAVGEQVMCIVDFNGDDVYVIGTVYGGDVQPKETGENVTSVVFDDGTICKYDSDSSELEIKAVGDIKITGNTSHAGDILIQGDLSVTGGLDVTGKIQAQQSIKAGLDVIAGTSPLSVSLRTHFHGPAGTPPVPQ